MLMRITTLRTHGRTFEIVLHEGKYCAIEDKYFDENGRLNTPLYGPALHCGDTVAECIHYTDTSCRVDELVAQGIDLTIACMMAVANIDHETAAKMLAAASITRL